MAGKTGPIWAANPISFIDPLGLLTNEAQAVVDKALADNNGDLFNAFGDVNTQRTGHEKCEPLRDAEHYLFAAYLSYTYGPLGVTSIYVVAPVYTLYKEALQATGHLPSNTSAPSWNNEVGAAYEGAAFGYSYNPNVRTVDIPFSF